MDFVLQWGRGQVTAEMLGRSYASIRSYEASMGPRSGDRGNHADASIERTAILASMGPRSGDRGNLQTSRQICRIPVASMGPRSGDRGNGLKREAHFSKKDRFNGAAVR